MAARLLRESLTRCRRDVSIPLQDEHIRNLQKRIDNDRAKPCEHIIDLCHSAFLRKAPRRDVEGFFRTGLAIVGSWYDANESIDLVALIQDETDAEAAANPLELRMATDLTPKSIADATDRLRAHLNALDRLVSACERVQVTGETETLSPPKPRMVA